MFPKAMGAVLFGFVSMPMSVRHVELKKVPIIFVGKMVDSPVDAYQISYHTPEL